MMNYSYDVLNNTLTVSEKFLKNAGKYNSAEYKLVKALRADNPAMQIVVAKKQTSMINIAAMKNAAQQLKPAAFKLWTYFAKNQQHFELDLSSKVVEYEFNMKKDMYDNAVKELIDKGFLVLCSKNTYYHFHEIPLPGNIPKKGKMSSEKREITTRNNTIETTNSGTKPPLQGFSSLPLKQVSMDAAGSSEELRRDKTIPSIRACNLYWLLYQKRHEIFYVKYLGNNVIQFPSGKQYRVIEDSYYDFIHVNYEGALLKDLRAAELARATKSSALPDSF